jgi:purine-binding chemotaxis protein CheW
VSSHCQYCTVHLGELLLGIEVMQVQEVIRPQPMTRVPLAAHVVRGLINLRGHIVTAVDLRARFGMPPLDAGQQSMNVVLRTTAGPVSLLVDRIGDVLEVPATVREAVPATVPVATRELLTGVYQLSGGLLLVLDIGRTLGLTSAAVAEAASGPLPERCRSGAAPCR